jgi:hypothetical protein
MNIFAPSSPVRARRHRLVGAFFAAALAGAVTIGVPGQASAQEHVVVRVAPPAARYEVRPVAPSPHHFWVHGYWGYHPQRGYEWRTGRWESPRPGYSWEESRWDHHDGRWELHEGHWRR